MIVACGIALIAGVLSGAMFGIVLSNTWLGWVIAYLSAFPLFLIGFSMGPRAYTIAASGAALIVLAGAGSMLTLVFLLVVAVPGYVIVRNGLVALVNRTVAQPFGTNPIGETLVTLTAIGTVTTAGMMVIAQQVGPGFVEILVPITERLLMAMSDLAGRTRTPADLDERIERILLFLPAAAVCSWILMLVFNAVMAQWITMEWGISGTALLRLTDMTVPRTAALVMAVAAVLTVALQGLPAQVAMVAAGCLAMTYMLLGMGVLQYWLREVRHGFLILCGVGMIVVVTSWASFGLLILGLVEQWAGLRRRWVRPGPGQEE